MSAAPHWQGASPTIARFRQFLAACAGAEPDKAEDVWHVVFQCATVVRLPSVSADAPEFAGYDSTFGRSYEEDWPRHRYRSPPTEVFLENRAVWEHQRTQLPDPAGAALRRAYRILLVDGYPYPGAGSDRNVLLLGPALKGENEGDQMDASSLWMLNWIDRSLPVFNVCLADSHLTANILGADLRRYDHMFPRAVLVIAPDLAAYSVTGPATYPVNAGDKK